MRKGIKGLVTLDKPETRCIPVIRSQSIYTNGNKNIMEIISLLSLSAKVTDGKGEISILCSLPQAKSSEAFKTSCTTTD